MIAPAGSDANARTSAPQRENPEFHDVFYTRSLFL